MKITWSCHICNEDRPDDKISVLTKPIMIAGYALGQQNIRYCNDKLDCIEKARYLDFFKSDKREGERHAR